MPEHTEGAEETRRTRRGGQDPERADRAENSEVGKGGLRPLSCPSPPVPARAPQRRVVFVFAGGGTGGHLFPALAIREELLRLDPGVRCIFVCSERALDAQVLGREGVEFSAIPARPFGLRPWMLARFLWKWGAAVRSARRILREAGGGGRAKVEVVAMGGFVAAPVVQAARAERRPVMLVNMDAAPGKANRWAARHARRIVTSAPVPDESWVRVPPIVRGAAVGPQAGASRRSLGLDPQRTTLLVTGASQGSRSINRFVLRMVEERGGLFAGWQVVHQTGPGEEEVVRARYAAAGLPALVRAFFTEMGALWSGADVAVSRAGAGSVAEAWANRTPTLFLPYPYHRDQHQRLNARPLEEAGGAVIATDRIEPELNVAEAGDVLEALMTDAPRREGMRAALAGLGPADGAARIAAALMC